MNISESDNQNKAPQDNELYRLCFTLINQGSRSKKMSCSELIKHTDLYFSAFPDDALSSLLFLIIIFICQFLSRFTSI